MTSLLACADCSSPPMLSRPACVRGTRSMVWMLIPGSNCACFSVYGISNRADEDPEPLIARWNGYTTKRAAERSAALGHTPEQAAAFLEALHENTFTKKSPWAASE